MLWSAVVTVVARRMPKPVFSLVFACVVPLFVSLPLIFGDERLHGFHEFFVPLGECLPLARGDLVLLPGGTTVVAFERGPHRVHGRAQAVARGFRHCHMAVILLAILLGLPVV